MIAAAEIKALTGAEKLLATTRRQQMGTDNNQL
jgi:hypothetical protein